MTKDENWEEWIIYMLNGIEETSKETIQRILKVKGLIDKTIDKLKKQASRIYSKELAEALFVHPYCKVDFITNEIGVERKAASRYLHQLRDIGVLELHKVGRENIFINKDLMTLLQK